MGVASNVLWAYLLNNEAVSRRDGFALIFIALGITAAVSVAPAAVDHSAAEVEVRT